MTAAKYRAKSYTATRAAWSATVGAEDVPCHLCGQIIADGQPWDLDHVRDTPGALHPAHAACNRREGARWRGAKRLAWGSSNLAATVRH